MGSELVNGAAFRQGQWAREDGQPYDSCPYDDCYPVARNSWQRGWHDPEPTITIPVAEYEGLVKRAKFWETVEDWEEIAEKLWDSDPLCQALRAAIKEQEG